MTKLETKLDPATIKPVVVEFWGPFACFCPAYAKVERVSLDIPTPSAVRGMLSAIYNKPCEFYWQVDRIEMLTVPGHASFKRNELKVKIGQKMTPILASDYRTQRNTLLLTNVRYRITARMIPREGFENSAVAFYGQFVRRASKGQCFTQPYFGMREFTAYFELSDFSRKPVSLSNDFGYVTYDVYNFTDFGSTAFLHSMYHCKMVNGVVIVPPYSSNAVMKIPKESEGDADAEIVV